MPELYLGKKNIERGGKLFCRLAQRQTEIFRKRAEGKEAAGEDAREERELIAAIADMTGGKL